MKIVYFNQKQNHPIEPLAGRLIGTYPGMGPSQFRIAGSGVPVLAHTVSRRMTDVKRAGLEKISKAIITSIGVIHV